MKQRPKRATRKNITNTFGSLGYLFCFLQWFWVVMIYFSMIQSAALFVAPPSKEPIRQLPSFTFTLPDPIAMTILAAITVIMVVIAIYALIKIPMDIVKSSNTMVHKTTEAIVPVVIKVQHKKDTKKTRAKITSRLILIGKAMLVVVPVALTAASVLTEKQSIDYSIAMVIGCGLAIFCVASFAVQYLLAHILRIKMSELW